MNVSSKTKKLIIAAIIVAGIPIVLFGLRHNESKESRYPKNQYGQTYGSAALALSYEEEPDLIWVRADGGQSGYVYAADLHGETPKSPEEAAKLSENKEKILLPVYELDGKTIIGTFTQS